MKDNIQKIIETAKQLEELTDLCRFLSDKLICEQINCDRCVLNKQMEALKDSLRTLLREAEAIHLLKRKQK